jgi:cob(I)alamin adenosyltransferase
MVFTGQGKGKTTAALGQAIRALGHGMRVCIIQFLKKETSYGELSALKCLSNLEIIPMGEGFISDKDKMDRHAKKAQQAWQLAKDRITSQGYDMVILDEINYALSYGLLGIKEVLDFLRVRPLDVHVVLTGRGAVQELVDLADLVTEMREIKHHLGSGVPAQKGIEF